MSLDKSHNDNQFLDWKDLWCSCKAANAASHWPLRLRSYTSRYSPPQGFLLQQHPTTSHLAARDRIPVGACTYSQRLSSLIPSNLWSSQIQLPLLFKAISSLDGNKEHEKIPQLALGKLKGMEKIKSKKGNKKKQITPRSSCSSGNTSDIKKPSSALE